MVKYNELYFPKIVSKEKLQNNLLELCFIDNVKLIPLNCIKKGLSMCL